MPEPSGKEAPEYGPAGYLPDRAAKRARKIVLREQMGLQWPIAAVVAAVALLAVGAVYYLTQTGPPGLPFVEAGALSAVDPRGVGTVEPASGPRALVVRGGGGVAVFEDPGVDVVWCREARRIEASDARVWDLEGRLVGGDGASLQPLRHEVFDGVLYVDTITELPAPPAEPAGERPTCR